MRPSLAEVPTNLICLHSSVRPRRREKVLRFTSLHTSAGRCHGITPLDSRLAGSSGRYVKGGYLRPSR